MTDPEYKQLLQDITDALLKPRDQEVLLLTRRLIVLENAELKDSAFIAELRHRYERVEKLANDLIIRLNTYESRLKQLEAKPQKESNPFYRWFKR